jgi:predicted dienelactone hydrolase
LRRPQWFSPDTDHLSRSFGRRTGWQAPPPFALSSQLVGAACAASGSSPTRNVASPKPNASADAAAPTVPAQTGRLPVGTATIELVDRSRRDPFAPDHRRRHILVEVYYPARGTKGRGRYMPRLVAKALATRSVPASALLSVRTNARPKAQVRRGHYPVVLFSPGYTVPHYLYAALLEDLSSRGYVVIALDHTYETEAVQFPNGTTVRRTLPETAHPLDLRAVSARIGDLSLVVARLRSLTRLAPLRAADPSKIGLFGHSLGGLTAANVAAAAQEVTFAADLSGSVYGKAVRKPFRRPFLILDGQGRDPTLRGWWAKLVGTRYWVTLKTAKHLNFSDWSWLVPALRRSGVKPKPRVPNLGAMDGFRAVALQRRYLGAFFDKCLKHQPTSAFDDPPPADVAIKR